jgi:hypothetical protein
MSCKKSQQKVLVSALSLAAAVAVGASSLASAQSKEAAPVPQSVPLLQIINEFLADDKAAAARYREPNSVLIADAAIGQVYAADDDIVLVFLVPAQTDGTEEEALPYFRCIFGHSGAPGAAEEAVGKFTPGERRDFVGSFHSMIEGAIDFECSDPGSAGEGD